MLVCQCVHVSMFACQHLKTFVCEHLFECLLYACDYMYHTILRVFISNVNSHTSTCKTALCDSFNHTHTEMSTFAYQEEQGDTQRPDISS